VLVVQRPCSELYASRGKRRGRAILTHHEVLHVYNAVQIVPHVVFASIHPVVSGMQRPAAASAPNPVRMIAKRNLNLVHSHLGLDCKRDHGDSVFGRGTARRYPMECGIHLSLEIRARSRDECSHDLEDGYRMARDDPRQLPACGNISSTRKACEACT
jgi:hypothetical protein